MPQATLLDFFKNQTPGPFADALSPAVSQLPQTAGVLEDDREVIDGGNPRQASSPAHKRLWQDSITAVAGSTQIRDRSEGASADDTKGPISLLSVRGLRIAFVESEHLPALKRLTGNLLPVKYPDNFFEGVVSEPVPRTFSRIALIDGKPIGWIRCRLDPFPEPTLPPSKSRPIYNRIYIQALCLLAPHRQLGIATSLLDTITVPSLLQQHNIARVYAHVWESNADALAWYERRGFRKAMKVDQYYRKLRPDGAWIVERDVETT